MKCDYDEIDTTEALAMTWGSSSISMMHNALLYRRAGEVQANGCWKITASIWPCGEANHYRLVTAHDLIQQVLLLSGSTINPKIFGKQIHHLHKEDTITSSDLSLNPCHHQGNTHMPA